MSGEGAWAAWSPLLAACAGDATLLQTAALAVVVALLLDHLWGEPPVWMHPVVAMGRCLGWMGKNIAPTTEESGSFKPFMFGMTAWCAGAALFFVSYAALQWLLAGQGVLVQGLSLGVLLKPLLSWRMLREEVLAVEEALCGSLHAGRERLRWLVSRDTQALSAGEVRESAIETLAENLSDSVVAPLLWFALAGLPGAALYRFANTADAMWGYPGWRGEGERRRHWQWAGKWAARSDDVLNWLPARLTAALLALVAPHQAARVLGQLPQQARVTPSPNGGWPMGAMALLLQVRLGKPGVYVLHPQGAVPQAPHLHQAVRLAAQVVLVLAALAALAGVGAGWMA